MAAKLTGQLIPGHTEGGHMTSRQDVAILKKKKRIIKTIILRGQSFKKTIFYILIKHNNDMWFPFLVLDTM